MDRLPLLPELHTSTRPSETAQWVTLARALELQRDKADRIVTDVYAPRFLSGLNRLALGPLQVAAPLVQLAERSGFPGLATSVLCRHRFIDEQLLAALPDVGQVLVLGAGYDNRAYRFAKAIGDRPVFEVDLAPMSRRKAAIIAGRPDLFAGPRVHRVEIDFRTDSLAQRLTGSGFLPGVPTFVAWEGVSMYLTRAAVVETLDAVRTVCGPATVVAMDFWQQPAGFHPYDQLRRTATRSLRLVGEPMTFSIAPHDVGRLLGEAGMTALQLDTGARLTADYATGGRRCDDRIFVVSARTA